LASIPDHTLESEEARWDYLLQIVPVGKASSGAVPFLGGMGTDVKPLLLAGDV